MNMEHRFSPVENVNGRKLAGYAAVFGHEARIASFVEVIRPGAFSETLRGRDILALVDHKPDVVLARTKSGTLRLHEDEHGLAFELDLPDTQAGRDALELAKRGDLGGMSFGFTVSKNGEIWRGEHRELVKINLHEISVVSAWPAYEGTSVQARRKMPPKLALALRYLETCCYGISKKTCRPL